MAKKVVGKIRKRTSKGMTRLVVPLRSPKTGHYAFKEVMIDLEDVEKTVEKIRS